MKLVALTGLHGAGKDTVADALPARKLAFADVLYREVARSYSLDGIEVIKRRETKEVARGEFRVNASEDTDFVCFCLNTFASLNTSCALSAVAWVEIPRSPRQILQWWGDYRRAQDPDYFVKAVQHRLYGASIYSDVVITDCRFPNEARMVRQLGGQVWQVVRPGHEPPRTGHASETTGDEFAPDVVIRNAGSLEDLRAVALKEWERVTR